MLPERIERYTIEHKKGDIVIRMRQHRAALIGSLISLVVVLASWYFGPHGPRPVMGWAQEVTFYRVWTGLFSFFFLLGIIGAMRREDWIITNQDIIVAESIGPWRRIRRGFMTHPLGIRVEWTPRSDDAIFPYRVRFQDQVTNDSGLEVEFQQSSSVDSFLKVLCSVRLLEIEDQRTSNRARHGNLMGRH